jgi:hypothetical protein
MKNPKSLSENSALGSTGYQPVPSGDSPDGMASVSAANLDARFPAATSPVPVGGSPTGAGESPAPPIFQTGSNGRTPAILTAVIPACECRAFVAQTGSLLCRRMPPCRVSTNREHVRLADTLPISNRRYGRLPICATLKGYIGAALIFVSVVRGQVADAPDGSVASIPVNYTEARAQDYKLPDPLTLANGQPVRDAQTWFEKRRPEIVKLFEENQFGRSPGRPADLSFDVFDKGTPAFDGKATRRQVTVYFSKDKSGPKMDLLIYLPAGASKPVPVLLNAGFTANSLLVDDPGVKEGEVWNAQQKQRVPASKGGRRFGRLNVLPALEKGFGIASVNYSDIDHDSLGGIAHGVRRPYLKPGQTEPAPDEWGSIAAWAWGLSRALDYLETDAGVDAKRVGLMGVSRLGKTVLWTAAHDPRFALVIASCSGEGGAALSRRNYGETIKHLVAPTRYPYQFCANYQKYGDHVDQFPVDAHMLIALIAPRPVLLQTGDTDRWSDPKGEFLAAVAAGPVYRLLGKPALETDQMPSAGQAVGQTLSYFMHAGGHGSIPSDWDQFFKFMQQHLQH